MVVKSRKRVLHEAPDRAILRLASALARQAAVPLLVSQMPLYGVSFITNAVGMLPMARKRRDSPVRFFTADGVEVETILDLAGRHKDELLTLARHAARRDFNAERGLVSGQT